PRSFWARAVPPMPSRSNDAIAKLQALVPMRQFIKFPPLLRVSRLGVNYTARFSASLSLRVYSAAFSPAFCVRSDNFASLRLKNLPDFHEGEGNAYARGGRCR